MRFVLVLRRRSPIPEGAGSFSSRERLGHASQLAEKLNRRRLCNKGATGGAHAVRGSRAEAGERTTGFSARVRTHPSRQLANPPRRKAAPTCGFSSRKHSSRRARRQQISSRAHSLAPARRDSGKIICRIGNKQMSWNERDRAWPGELWRGHRRIRLRGKGVGYEKYHDGEFVVPNGVCRDLSSLTSTGRPVRIYLRIWVSIACKGEWRTLLVEETSREIPRRSSGD